ncbi:hypothetical protein GIB67_010820 [Kingdonia uniflora]|uniref:Uncharacterized protein n=1 Tax=Kingdonia uniflora TaxID=39325 RepID=A0A7J7L966_9MAGN|nr:hypothetical protein GIB67_010820 [Kingdonia uniflora]
MSFFVYEEPKHLFKTSKAIRSSLRNVFDMFREKFSTLEEEFLVGDGNINHKELIILTIRAHAMEEKLRRKERLTSTDSIQDINLPMEELQTIPVEMKAEEEVETEAFYSVDSHLSRCSSIGSKEAFLSVDSNFSRSLSANGIDLWETQRESILREFSHCEGWPFGLYRKQMWLPPMPKSPLDSWSWRKSTKMHA